MTDTVPPERVTWLAREQKRETDGEIAEIICRALKDNGEAHCLTFPARDWIQERELSVRRPDVKFVFHGVEQNRLVYRAAYRRAISLAPEISNANFMMEHCTLIKFLGKLNSAWRSSKYDLVYPDWMGTWTQAKGDEIEQMFTRRIFKASAFLRVSMMLARGRPESMSLLQEFASATSMRMVSDAMVSAEAMERLISSSNGPIKVAGVTGLVRKHARKNGYQAVPVYVDLYAYVPVNVLRATSMISMLFKIDDLPY